MSQFFRGNKDVIRSCAIWVVICLVLSAFAGWISIANIGPWYTNLTKPSFNPPAWIFGPIWTVLYIMIGISGGIIWHNRRGMPWAFILFISQLILNVIWTPIFFGLHEMGWAFADMVLLWIFILVTIFYAGSKNKAAAWLLVPYLAWVTFAAVLNYQLLTLNSVGFN